MLAKHQTELGLPTLDDEGNPEPIPTYGDHCVAQGWWRYIADVNEDGTDYSLYWNMMFGRIADPNGFGNDLLNRAFGAVASAIAMTGQDYREDYDASFVDPVGAESLYFEFNALDPNAQIPGNAYWELIPQALADACNISPLRTWAWVFAKESQGERIGASTRLNTLNYQTVISQVKRVPTIRGGCGFKMFELVLTDSVSNVRALNVEEARERVNAPNWDYEEVS